MEPLGEGGVEALLRLVGAIQTCRLIDESFVCVVRRGHPLTRGKLTAARFAEAAHALIAPSGEAGSFVDTALQAARVASRLEDTFGLTLLPLPPELHVADFTLNLWWHERHAADPAHVWFRALFADVARAIPGPRRRPRTGAS